MSGSSRQLTLKKGAVTWRSGVKTAMHAASQLPGRGPTDVDDGPLHLHVNKNPIMTI